MPLVFLPPLMKAKLPHKYSIMVSLQDDNFYKYSYFSRLRILSYSQIYR